MKGREKQGKKKYIEKKHKQIKTKTNKQTNQERQRNMPWDASANFHLVMPTFDVESSPGWL